MEWGSKCSFSPPLFYSLAGFGLRLGSSCLQWTSMGVSIRDSAGTLLKAAAVRLLGRLSPHVAENLAIREGVRLAAILGLGVGRS
ncbi:hypothetical protein L484_013694 [Morus notabilis]|uniref:RNase H type-1 domain-containing protein n=1 Tax=Morus notabilis TaxID=981085 RepID=W9QN15_9ROSA|nr:hypothetical protein L484_013694 [Morus notabilis]